MVVYIKRASWLVGKIKLVTCKYKEKVEDKSEASHD